MNSFISITHNIPNIKRLLRNGEYEDALSIIQSLHTTSMSIKKEIEINFLTAICYTEMFEKRKAFDFLEYSYNLNSSISSLILLKLLNELNYKNNSRPEQLYNRLVIKISDWYQYYTI